MQQFLSRSIPILMVALDLGTHIFVLALCFDLSSSHILCFNTNFDGGFPDRSVCLSSFVRLAIAYSWWRQWPMAGVERMKDMDWPFYSSFVVSSFLHGRWTTLQRRPESQMTLLWIASDCLVSFPCSLFFFLKKRGPGFFFLCAEITTVLRIL